MLLRSRLKSTCVYLTRGNRKREADLLLRWQCDRSALGEVAESLGAVVAKSYSSAVTHLVHAGTKTTETFKEFKTRPSQLAIVHPRWIEEVRSPSLG